MTPAGRSGGPTDSAGLVVPPVLILSDLHLAHPATYFTDPISIAPLLDGMRTVVFNGDSCELLSVKYRSEATKKLALISELCLDHGVRPIFLTGNHDSTVSSKHDLSLFDGKVVVTHGDVLHPWLAPWARDAVHLKRERRRLLTRRPPPADWEETLELCKEIGSVASRYDAKGRRGILARMLMVGKFALQPWRVFQALHYWSNVVHYAHGLQEQFFPNARLVVIGHTHRPGVWHLPSFTLVNTGSYQPLSKPLTVRLTENDAVVHRVEQNGDQLRFGAVVHHMHLDV